MAENSASQNLPPQDPAPQNPASQDSEAGAPGVGAGTFARITGTVQGVNYRAVTRRRAEERGLTGWVRNADDGAVELLAHGDQQSVDSLLRWCRRGPKRAEVEAVDARQATAAELETLPESGFVVRG